MVMWSINAIDFIVNKKKKNKKKKKQKKKY